MTTDANKVESNPHKWVTREKFLEFMTARGVSMNCELCGSDKAWWIDTGSKTGYVARIASMPQRPDGLAATGDTYQMPLVRAVCLNCGHVRLHAMNALDVWRAAGDSPIAFSQGDEVGGKVMGKVEHD